MRYVLIVNSIVLLLTLSRADDTFGQSAEYCLRNPIDCAIKRINPRARNSYRLSNYLNKYSKRFETDPLISVAIIAQESMFRNIVAGDDYGLFQFNLKTIKFLGLDKIRLLEDLEYATLSHVKLLRRKINICTDKYPSYPWACYHSSTETYARQYKKKVLYYYKKIKGGNRDGNR